MPPIFNENIQLHYPAAVNIMVRANRAEHVENVQLLLEIKVISQAAFSYVDNICGCAYMAENSQCVRICHITPSIAECVHIIP